MVRKKTPLSIRDLALMGLFSAILLGVQLAFAFLPNIELVSLLIILYTRHLKYRALPVIYVFVLLEGLIFGFGIWWIIYLYIWAILFALTMMAQKNQSLIGWAMISGGFGLFFGALGSILYLFLSGPQAAFAWFVAGIPFDIAHGVGNFLVCLALFKPLDYLLDRMERQRAG